MEMITKGALPATQIRNPNIETRNNKTENSMFEKFETSNLEFVSDFVLRVSNFIYA